MRKFIHIRSSSHIETYAHALRSEIRELVVSNEQDQAIVVFCPATTGVVIAMTGTHYDAEQHYNVPGKWNDWAGVLFTVLDNVLESYEKSRLKITYFDKELIINSTRMECLYWTDKKRRGPRSELRQKDQLILPGIEIPENDLFSSNR